MDYDLAQVCNNFQIYGDYISGMPYGSGHINDTFMIKYNQAGENIRYILQRINNYVFEDTIKLMENISRVTKHISQKLIADGVEDVTRRVLTVVETNDSLPYYIDEYGNTWRVYLFIEKAQTYDILTSNIHAHTAAKAFGNFQQQLSDLDQTKKPLFETIPNFHNGPWRYQTFLDTLANDPHNRAKNAKNEIDFLISNASLFDIFPKLINDNKIPIRITHNDTKINNIMIDDETGEAVCVIDLDTVMPGLALYDFGDIVRTTVSASAEDEINLEEVYAQIPRFEAIVSGYLAGAGQFLNQTEKNHLVHAGKLITLMIGTRFITDYLNGDQYFKVHREGQNLDRCRTQFKLVQSIIDQEETMLKCVERYSQTPILETQSIKPKTNQRNSLLR